ncbi:MAG: hypothetical protein JWL77_5060 [Chthonomonadaceae bacterium]|nr:hypothetical protein [Chthonomonadaceae bacterium]
MTIRTRITLSTVLGIALAGVCLSSAQAQSGAKTGTKMHHEAMRDNDMDETTVDDYDMPEPAPIGYPFAAPGGLHLYHWTDFGHEALEPDSAYSKKMDNEDLKARRIHERMKHDSAMTKEDRMRYGGYYMTDENGMMVSEEAMVDPAPIGYPFAGPGALHLYHYTDYSGEGLAEGSATLKKMDNMEAEDEMRHERMKWYGGRTVDENEMTMYEEMKQPAPLGYPFAAPGGLHLYHYTDYSMEGIGEGSATMKKMDNDEKMEKKMKRSKTPK